MHRIVVEEQRWISERRFLHALNYCMLLPGPEAQQLATYIGWLMHRTLGGLMAGGLFVVPGIVAIMGLSYVYAAFGNVPLVVASFFGLKAAVLAIVLEAVFRIGKRALKNNVLRALAAAAFVGIFFFDVPFPVIILGAGLIGLAGAASGAQVFKLSGGHSAGGGKEAPEAETVLGDALPAHARPNAARALAVAGLWLTLWLVPVIALLAMLGADNVFSQIAVFFSKMAVVTFGGAYAVLAYVAQQAVEHYGWLKPGEMLDGLGMAETTPGPLIMVLQFVGFMAAYRDAGTLSPMLAGTLGGLLATWVTFTPCFLWIFVGAPFIELARDNKSPQWRALGHHRRGGGRGSQPGDLVCAPCGVPAGDAGARLWAQLRHAGHRQRRSVGARAVACRRRRDPALPGGHDPDPDRLHGRRHRAASGRVGRVSGAAHSSCAASCPTNAMRSMLVAPGVPSGTPATMITRWPALAKPSLKARRQARCTMSSWSWASSATTQCTPHTSDSLRPVSRLGEIATIGGCGRSRATRRPVAPELVQQMMADSSRVSAICRAAALMASAPVASGSVRCAWMMVR